LQAGTVRVAKAADPPESAPARTQVEKATRRAAESQETKGGSKNKIVVYDSQTRHRDGFRPRFRGGEKCHAVSQPNESNKRKRKLAAAETNQNQRTGEELERERV